MPAAYNFVINFMSNHSKEEPSGYLDGYNFKTFFGVTGEPGSFKWNRGQERVPDNWVSCENFFTKNMVLIYEVSPPINKPVHCPRRL